MAGVPPSPLSFGLGRGRGFPLVSGIMALPLRHTFGWLLTLAGGLVCLFGIWAIGAYAWGVIEVLDAPDKSWIFWGLAILFIGLICLPLGAGMVVYGRRIVRNRS